MSYIHPTYAYPTHSSYGLNTRQAELERKQSTLDMLESASSTEQDQLRQQLQDTQARVTEYETHVERLSEAVKSAEEQVPRLESDIAAVKDVLESERAEVIHTHLQRVVLHASHTLT